MRVCSARLGAASDSSATRGRRAILPENASGLQPRDAIDVLMPTKQILGNVERRSMLNKLDDYPIHQTPEPIAHAATSDRNAYDRTWFNGYSQDGSRYFGVGMAIYPHRGV